MAIQITEDLVENARMSSDRDGMHLSRVFCVKGLNSGPQTLYFALMAIDGSSGFYIPKINQPHESIPGIFCNNVTAGPWAVHGRTTCKVVAEYGWYSSTQIKISGSRQVLSANKDPTTGKIFTVDYTPPAPGKKASNYVQFNVTTSHIILEITRIEPFNPLQKIGDYEGTVCLESGYQGIGDTAGLWCCQSIEGERISLGRWSVTYVLEYAPEGWYQYGFFQDNATHIIPTDITSNPPVPKKTGQLVNGITAYLPDQQPFAGLMLPAVSIQNI